MESGGVSKMTALLIKRVFKSDFLSRKSISGTKWSFLILTVILSAWPITAGTLTGKKHVSI